MSHRAHRVRDIHRGAVSRRNPQAGRDATTALLLAALFGAVAVSVTTQATQPLDDRIRRRQPHPRRGPARAVAMGIREALRPPVQLAVGAGVALHLHHRGVPRAPRVLSAVACTVLADKGIKRVLERRRPPGYRGDETWQSFPSGHTAATTAMSVATARLLVRWGDATIPRATLAAFAASALVAESRLLLDDHWPSDVVAGALLGGAIAHAVLAL